MEREAAEAHNAKNTKTTPEERKATGSTASSHEATPNGQHNRQLHREHIGAPRLATRCRTQASLMHGRRNAPPPCGCMPTNTHRMDIARKPVAASAGPDDALLLANPAKTLFANPPCGGRCRGPDWRLMKTHPSGCPKSSGASDAKRAVCQKYTLTAIASPESNTPNRQRPAPSNEKHHAIA